MRAFSLDWKKVDKQKLIKWIALSIFLMAITILPSFEAIDLRYRKSVDLGENPVGYQLKSGDIIEQRILLDKNDRLDDLRIWLTADTSRANKGTLQFVLTQGDLVSESRIDTSQMVSTEYVSGYLPSKLKLKGFTDGELLLTIKVLDLEEGSSISTRYTTEAIYGFPQAILNGNPCGGTLSLNFKVCQLHDFEYNVSICLVFVIIIISTIASFVMTYTEENPKTGWLLIAIYIALAMATYSLEYPAKTWEGESKYEGATFFYNNVANMRILNVIRQLEGGMYLSTVQNIIMIVAVRILHLRRNLFIAVESMGVLYLVLCLAPFCSHYFKKYFTRTFRFICPLLIACFAPINTEFHAIGYFGAFFLVLLLLYDFEKINNFIYAFVLLIIPAVCTSKMTFVAFAPVMAVYYLLFRKEMNRKKKICIIEIGISSFMEAFLSLLLKHGVQGGHGLGTIQKVTLPTMINKIVYYTIQSIGIQFRGGISNANQMLVNICMSILTIVIFAFTMWQLVGKGRYKREAKFILVMFALIVCQSLVMLLTTPDWHADVNWKQSLGGLPGYGFHLLTFYIAGSAILLTCLWIILQYFKPHFEYLLGHLAIVEQFAFRAMALFVTVTTTFFYINQHPGPKSFESANPIKVTVADWKAYLPMLDSDAFCIGIDWNRWSCYRKNASVSSIATPRSASVDISGVAELSDKTSIVFYAHKTAATNQILDRYYYISIYDKNGNLISKLRQINPDAERLYIAFYPEEGITNIGRVDFSYEDGTPAFVDDAIQIGYR